MGGCVGGGGRQQSCVVGGGGRQQSCVVGGGGRQQSCSQDYSPPKHSSQPGTLNSSSFLTVSQLS